MIENKGQAIPSDLIEVLLGDASTRSRIEARWDLDEAAGVLHLSKLQADEESVDQEVITIPIKSASQVRVTLGTRQYNVFPSAAEEP